MMFWELLVGALIITMIILSIILLKVKEDKTEVLEAPVIDRSKWTRNGPWDYDKADAQLFFVGANKRIKAICMRSQPGYICLYLGIPNDHYLWGASESVMQRALLPLDKRSIMLTSGLLNSLPFKSREKRWWAVIVFNDENDDYPMRTKSFLGSHHEKTYRSMSYIKSFATHRTMEL